MHLPRPFNFTFHLFILFGNDSVGRGEKQCFLKSHINHVDVMGSNASQIEVVPLWYIYWYCEGMCYKCYHALTC